MLIVSCRFHAPLSICKLGFRVGFFRKKDCFLGQFYGYTHVVRLEIDGLVICRFFVGGIQRCSLDPHTHLRWRAILRSPPS